MTGGEFTGIHKCFPYNSADIQFESRAFTSAVTGRRVTGKHHACITVRNMSEYLRIAIDAMGGDNAPGEIVKGAVLSLSDQKNIKIVLVGREDEVNAELAKYSDYDKDRIEVVHAPTVIDINESPTAEVRRKKDSSMVVAMNLYKEGKVDCVASAGSTGALFVCGTTIVKRIRGIERTPLAPVIPTAGGLSLLVDSGANVDARPECFVQYAQMGSIYMEKVLGVKNPRVGLVNIGVEEEKGNQQVKAAFELLKECPDINFIGNVEAREIPNGVCDVIVCDAFVGNVILKLYEGTAKALVKIIKGGLMESVRGKIGGLLVKKPLKKTLKTFDASEYGGAPFLGLSGLVVKMHGSSKHKDVRSAIKQCVLFNEQNIPELYRVNIAEKAKNND